MSANRTELGSRARGPAVTGLEGTSRIQLVPLFDGVYRKHGFDRIVLLCRGDWPERYRPLSHDLNGVWNGNGGKLGIAELLSSHQEGKGHTRYPAPGFCYSPAFCSGAVCRAV